MNGRNYDPAQARFWQLFGERPLKRTDVEPFGVQFVRTAAQLEQLHRRFAVPTIVDIGYGILGAPVGYVFVDDTSGLAVAYAPPEVLRRRLPPDVDTERKKRGPCPVCGKPVQLVGNTTDGRFYASCLDAFTPRQWRARGPRSITRRAVA